MDEDSVDSVRGDDDIVESDRGDDKGVEWDRADNEAGTDDERAGLAWDSICKQLRVDSTAATADAEYALEAGRAGLLEGMGGSASSTGSLEMQLLNRVTWIGERLFSNSWE